MGNINLLSEKYISRIVMRKHTIKMAAIMAVIFLFWLLLVLGVNITNGYLIQANEAYRLIKENEKYLESDRIAKELASRANQEEGVGRLKDFNIKENMDLYYLATVTEEMRRLTALEIILNNKESKITVKAGAKAKAEIVRFTEGLESLKAFKRIDLAEIKTDGEDTYFTIELAIGVEK